MAIPCSIDRRVLREFRRDHRGQAKRSCSHGVAVISDSGPSFIKETYDAFNSALAARRAHSHRHLDRAFRPLISNQPDPPGVRGADVRSVQYTTRRRRKMNPHIREKWLTCLCAAQAEWRSMPYKKTAFLDQR